MSTKRILNILIIVFSLLAYGFITAKALISFDHWRVEKARNLMTEADQMTDKKAKFIKLQEAALLNPNEETYLKTGSLADELGLDGQADSYLSRVKTAEGFYKLGITYLGNQQFLKAKNAFIKALNKTDSSEYYLALGKSELGLNQIKEALNSFEMSKGLKENDENRYYVYLAGSILGEQVQEPKLNQTFKEEANLLAQHEDKSNRANIIYNLLNTLNYPQTAVAYLEEQAQKDNHNRDGYLLLVEHYTRTNMYQKQYETLQRAKELDPYYPQTYQQLAVAARLLKKNTEAQKYESYFQKLSW
jgi:tetratricopeptide (TPR) repeat protein